MNDGLLQAKVDSYRGFIDRLTVYERQGGRMTARLVNARSRAEVEVERLVAQLRRRERAASYR